LGLVQFLSPLVERRAPPSPKYFGLKWPPLPGRVLSRTCRGFSSQGTLLASNESFLECRAVDVVVAEGMPFVIERFSFSRIFPCEVDLTWQSLSTVVFSLNIWFLPVVDERRIFWSLSFLLLVSPARQAFLRGCSPNFSLERDDPSLRQRPPPVKGTIPPPRANTLFPTSFFRPPPPQRPSCLLRSSYSRTDNHLVFFGRVFFFQRSFCPPQKWKTAFRGPPFFIHFFGPATWSSSPSIS